MSVLFRAVCPAGHDAEWVQHDLAVVNAPFCVPTPVAPTFEVRCGQCDAGTLPTTWAAPAALPPVRPLRLFGYRWSRR